jgi:hypothetical protein
VPEPSDHVPSYDAKDIGSTIEQQKERYLLKTTIQMALRSLYGDKANALFVRFADQMAEELQRRNVALRRT